jgi:signal transduction histidine kinase
MMREARLPAHLKRLLALAEQQCQRVVKLIEALLDVTRIQVGNLALSVEELDLQALTREVVERFEAELSQAGIGVIWRAEAPVVGTWDRARIEQVVTNLVLNAIKYGAGHPLEIHLIAAHDRAKLVVADKGIGIEPSRLPHIFERFERGVSARHYSGLGLGLYITRQIIVAHGGTIDVESELGVGTTFVVELPRHGRSARAGVSPPPGGSN